MYTLVAAGTDVLVRHLQEFDILDTRAITMRLSCTEVRAQGQHTAARSALHLIAIIAQFDALLRTGIQRIAGITPTAQPAAARGVYA